MCAHTAGLTHHRYHPQVVSREGINSLRPMGPTLSVSPMKSKFSIHTHTHARTRTHTHTHTYTRMHTHPPHTHTGLCLPYKPVLRPTPSSWSSHAVQHHEMSLEDSRAQSYCSQHSQPLRKVTSIYTLTQLHHSLPSRSCQWTSSHIHTS